jgi:hypothetical protein
MPYTVKSFSGIDETVETYETHDEAVKRFEELKKFQDAAYVYDPNEEMIKSYSDTYLDYHPQVETCVYCGSEYLDGYCWKSPDGSHQSAGID